MKSRHDPRHKRRRRVVQQLFAQSFSDRQEEEILDTTTEIVKKQDGYDLMIADAAPQWPIDKLNKIDLAILRLAIYELIQTETPPKVVVDEAVELAKEFGSESSPSFINGVLGNIMNKVVQTKPDEKNDSETSENTK